MSKIIYSSICSLDGFIADSTGNFQWAAPDEEVHAFINDLERPIGTYLYGRRMYEVMAFWEDLPDADQQSAAMVISPRSGRPPTKSSFRLRWHQLPHRRPRWNADSIRIICAASKQRAIMI